MPTRLVQGAGGALLILAVAAGADGVNPEAIDRAIEEGVAYLFSVQKDDGTWKGTKSGHGQPMGPTALCTYALLHSGVPADDERIVRALKALRGHEPEKTYTLACYASAFGEAVRSGAKQYRGPLRYVARQLIGGLTSGGGYTYTVPPHGRWDNSNTNYGVFGVWVAQRVLSEVPRGYWRRTARHWMGAQNDDGGWPYRAGGKSTAAMVAAGTATLFVCFDTLRAESFADCGADYERDPIYTRIEKALGWLDANFAATMRGGKLGHSDMYYYLYNVERVGLAAGYKYFGKHDWFERGAAYLLGKQRGDGFWKGKWGREEGTAFALLFLARGREPVMFNKLQFDGDWNNRPRDCAYVTRWAGPELEHDVNWQIINLATAPEDWHDAPIVYISGSKRPEFTDAQLDKLRRYVHQGGTILSVTECRGHGFRDGIREVYGELFPDYELTECGPDHDLYRAHFDIGHRPRFSVVTNGVRPLAIHTDEDLSRSWQLQRHATNPRAFQAAANVYLYVTDKHYRLRGEKTWPDEPSSEPRGSTQVARIRHEGNYDPEPLAWQRFARLMGRRERWGVDVAEPMPIARLGETQPDIAAMTGTEAFELTAEDRERLRDYVASGGTVIIDAAGGSEAFADSAEGLIRRIWGDGSLERLGRRADLYNLKDHVIDDVRYRRRARVRGAPSGPDLRVVRVLGRPAVIYSRYDLTTGLAGVRAYRCRGYAPQTAYELMRNVVLLTARTSSRGG